MRRIRRRWLGLIAAAASSSLIRPRTDPHGADDPVGVCGDRLNIGGSMRIEVVIDGRQPKHGIGVTMQDLADIMIAESAFPAMNFNGRGSTGMDLRVTDGTVVLHAPSEESTRPVANHPGVRWRIALFRRAVHGIVLSDRSGEIAYEEIGPARRT